MSKHRFPTGLTETSSRKVFHDGCAKRDIFSQQILNKNRLCLAHCALNRSFTVNMLFSYFWASYNIVKFQFYCVNISYLVDRCICPAHSRSRQTLEKNASSWALARTGSVLFTRQVAV